MNLINTIESMKKVFLFVAAVLLCLACNEAGRTVSVTVSNATSLERSGEMVEVSMGEVSSKLHLPDTAQPPTERSADGCKISSGMATA